MNIFQLTCFLTVAETLSFARSAERLNITQPAVTHQIHALEAELDLPLFTRTTHSVALTSAGLLLIDDARTMVNTSMRVKRRFETMNEQDFSTLDIGCHSDGYFQILSEVLHDFAKLYPQIHPHVRMVPTQSLLYRLLEDEKADIIFGTKDVGVKKYPGVYKELKKSPLVCVCAKGHPLSSRQLVTREELQETKLILFDPTNPSFFTAQFQRQMMVNRHPADLYFCESTTTAIILAKAGYGVFFSPDVFMPEDATMAKIPVQDADAISFGMYYRSLQSNAPLKGFVELIKERF